MESKYSLTPSDPDEGNCHTVCKATMSAMGLDWPSEFDNFEHHGRANDNPELSNTAQVKEEKKAKTPSKRGLNE